MKKHSKVDLLIWIVAAETVGALSAMITGSFSDFFDTHTKPPLMPPAWVFPIVWVILYALMGLSAYLIYASDKDNINRSCALTTYWAQLAVNFSWSIIFFRFQALWAAFIVILVLLGLIIYMILQFRKINKLAAYLNIPYMAWVAFASYLNLATAILN